MIDCDDCCSEGITDSSSCSYVVCYCSYCRLEKSKSVLSQPKEEKKSVPSKEIKKFVPPKTTTKKSMTV